MKWILLVAAMLAAPLALILLVGAMLPRAHVVSRSASFHQPPEQVWAVVTGPPDWRPDISKFEQLRGDNSLRRWRETDKRGQTITYEGSEQSIVQNQVTVKRFTSRITDKNLPFGGTWTIDVAPQGAGTLVTVTENGEVFNPVFRFVSRFIMGHSATIDAYLKALKTKLA